MKKFFKVFALILAIVAVLSACSDSTQAPSATASASSKKAKFTYEEKTSVTDEERIDFFNKTAFVGSSISVGLENYIDYNKDSLNIGNPIMLVRESYSFNNDKNKRKNYIPQLNGEPMQAKEAVANSGVERVFIAMGTNDLYGGVESAYNAYIEYLNGIVERNEGVEIYIESTTSVAGKGKNELNAENIKALNEKMKAYCESQPNMFFVDVTSKMNDENGRLKDEYSSDNFVHLTNSAYEMWINAVIDYVDNLIMQRGTAKNAVDAALESGKKSAIEQAQAVVDKLDDGVYKTQLSKDLLSK